MFAQQIEIKSIEKLKGTETGGYYHPVFSPDGKWLLTSSENYVGLKKISLKKSEITTLTDDAGAGFDVRINRDGSEILYKKTEMQNNLRYSSLYRYSVSGKKAESIESATRDKINPFFEGKRTAYVKGRGVVRDNKRILKSGEAVSVPFINIEDQKMALYNGDNKKILAPNGANDSYYWASVSPNGKQIVYAVASGGTFVCTVDGTDVKSLGKLNAPVWLNDKWVVGMNDKDDGDFVISSEIVAATVDGKVRKVLEIPQVKIAMYPSASADGKRIAFNSEKGEIYILNMNVK
jgi:Tol biopolymer transport system component